MFEWVDLRRQSSERVVNRASARRAARLRAALGDLQRLTPPHPCHFGPPSYQHAPLSCNLLPRYVVAAKGPSHTSMSDKCCLSRCDGPTGNLGDRPRKRRACTTT